MCGKWNLDGPASPFSTLNIYIKAMTGCVPLNYNWELVSQEPLVGPIIIDSFQWDKLDQELPLKSRLETCVYKWFTLGEPLIMNDHERAIVQYGLGRFIETRDTQKYPKRSISVAEPLALISICRHLIGKESFATHVLNHLEYNSGKGFEVVAMVAFTRLLQNKLRISDLFNFHKQQPEWSHETAQIVSRASKSYVNYHSILHEPIFSDQALPFQAFDPEDVINWLTNDSSPAWCIPDSKMGPDLMTRIKLSNGNNILIVVQAKCWGVATSKGVSLPASETASAIRSLTPSRWFSETVRDSLLEIAYRDVYPETKKYG